jgi:heptosyltransferase-2
LGRNFPEAEITVAAKPWVAPVYDGHPAVSRVLIYDRDNRHGGRLGPLRLAAEVRKEHFDLAVLFQNALEAGLIFALARVPLRLGYNTDGRGWLLNPKIKLRPEDKTVHETEYYMRILRRAGLDAPKASAHPYRFHLSQEALDRADQRLDRLGLSGVFRLGLAPGASYGPAKQWPPRRFAEAADRILRVKQGAALIFGSRAESETTAAVARRLPVRGHDLAGRTELTEAAALISRCHLFLTNDSGLMHAAASVGVPVVAIFGSTNPRTTAPVGRRVRIIRHDVDCAPCLKTHCDRPTHPCMDLVSPEEAASAGLDLLR